MKRKNAAALLGGLYTLAQLMMVISLCRAAPARDISKRFERWAIMEPSCGDGFGGMKAGICAEEYDGVKWGYNIAIVGRAIDSLSPCVLPCMTAIPAGSVVVGAWKAATYLV